MCFGKIPKRTFTRPEISTHDALNANDLIWMLTSTHPVGHPSGIVPPCRLWQPLRNSSGFPFKLWSHLFTYFMFCCNLQQNKVAIIVTMNRIYKGNFPLQTRFLLLEIYSKLWSLSTKIVAFVSRDKKRRSISSTLKKYWVMRKP